MLVGGLLILAGLYISSCKVDAYIKWCDKQISIIQQDVQIRVQARAQVQAKQGVDVDGYNTTDADALDPEPIEV